MLGRIVGFAQRRAESVTTAILLLSVVSGFYAATNLKIDTAIGHMLPGHVGWRQNELALDYANFIALPLLFGIGVAFDIYFVMNWRAGPAASCAARRERSASNRPSAPTRPARR
jgi:hypothetical protein